MSIEISFRQGQAALLGDDVAFRAGEGTRHGENKGRNLPRRRGGRTHGLAPTADLGLEKKIPSGGPKGLRILSG